MQDFAHRVALVTGASTGIGEAVAAELFHRGATVMMTGRHRETLAAAAAKIDPSERRAIPLVMDVRDPQSVSRGIEGTLQRCGGLHCLVNNAGITGPHEVPISQYANEDWREVIETCLSGTFFGMKYALPAIVASGGGAVVNLSSANGVVGIAGIAPYTAAKHGILGLTRSAALEFAAQGVRVNAVGPGYVDTPAMGELPAQLRRQMAASHPMGRMATREEVAKTVAFLLSDDSSFTTGAFYSIDGGYTAR
ncbi:SDR family NAD(P)-dependent oxidoreductase [Serratia ficaria]|uniref:3-oxoacyl-[acyl-carrier-protein] reductase FabG n=1 Tax=Serratia ficaria TaxID=61651 RepID=A0A240BMH3_SERFI|nr:SDR family NAD(P)-dependent oxidoreductase [Serratia ficaria]REF45799.1 NAD(P)-dependent dehydrogenase (short-subunit alcohol dehydrogenase family) [Serratia ficaria]CAI0847360.1 3-oxoacyl-[acyl-carrier-protein] reductase FabG [Serratia ficaria]CAI0934928.1 3-oxoacyl-[acyl-carrier-protein] reductase FabG [Serratia ficaria]CAI0985471.1 3-oxoacyl-[acyl-carrier-protein] reductase FabG [Serratia ficaria]CAI2034959.1 3-oxoacyl-[acyl-carrier-protein] reductase FabG [Serratia ficaria]